MEEPEPRPSRAIVYIPDADYERSAASCLDHVDEQGYNFKGVTKSWTTVWRMFSRGEVTVCVVSSPADLDPARKPRVEFVSHQPTKPGGRYWDERTRVIRRPTAGE